MHVQMQVVYLQDTAPMLYAQHRSCIHGITQMSDGADGCCCRHVMLQPCNVLSKRHHTQVQLV
jgi:hypothetical protein